MCFEMAYERIMQIEETTVLPVFPLDLSQTCWDEMQSILGVLTIVGAYSLYVCVALI